MTKTPRQLGESAHRKARIRHMAEGDRLQGMTADRSTVRVLRRGRRRYEIAISVSRGGLIRNPATELARMLSNALRRPPVADVKIYDSTGALVRILDGYMRTVKWDRAWPIEAGASE